MKKERYTIGFILIAVIAMISAMLIQPVSSQSETVHAALKQPQILVLNAYHVGYEWTDQQVSAITDYFDHSPERPIYYVEYLDWKRHPYEYHLERMSTVILSKYEDIDIDLILATDDIGMQFAIDYRDQLAPDVPIVFTGVYAESAAKRMAGVDNITGVIEAIDSIGHMEMVLEAKPNLEHIYLINDHTESGKDVENAILEGMDFFQSQYGYTYDVINDLTYREIDRQLADPVKNSIVMVGTHSIDINGDAIPNETFVEELSSWIDVPIFSPYEFNFNHGSVGGLLLSGRLQGLKGAEMSMKIIGGVPAEAFEISAEDTVYYGIDYTYAERHKLPLERLTMDYVIINRPVSVFEQYRTAILMTMGIIVMLSFFIVLLSINVRIRKKAQYELEMKHDELFETYETLASSEEELKVQNEELLEQQREIHFLAFYDKMTRLPNRNAVEAELKRMLERSLEMRSILMIVDIDNFNYINTAYGHNFGDEVLKYVATELRDLRREGYYVGRIAGDEFFVMKNLEVDDTEEEVLSVIDRIFSQMVNIENKQIHITKSIGYTIYPEDGSDYDDLMSRTDMAKKKMKQSGKNMTSRFIPSMNKEMGDRIILTKALKSAIKDKEMYVVFQPQYNIISEKIVGYEALVRWHSELVGDVSPAIFIPLAEDIGEIVDIGSFVLEEACRFLRKYGDIFEDGFRLSVNISVLQLLRQDFIDLVKGLIDSYNVSPNMLEFEVTESVLIESFELINERLIRLKIMGITISLDDFGTGFSSLTYLEKLPISTLKIDKSFIDGILVEGDKHFFSKSIVDIAHKLGLRVIAEGVEEQEQVDYLKACGNHVIQGYWYSKPVDAIKAIEMYNEQ